VRLILKHVIARNTRTDERSKRLGGPKLPNLPHMSMLVLFYQRELMWSIGEIPDFEQRRAGHDLEWLHSSGGILGKNPVKCLLEVVKDANAFFTQGFSKYHKHSG